MILKQLFSNTYYLVKNNLILVQPLLIFFLVLSILVSPVAFSGGINIAVIIMFASVAGLFCAFWAGWYNMFHKSIEYVDKLNITPEEKALNSLNLFKEFFPGVGKYFLKIVLGFIIYFIFIVVLILVIQLIGDKFIGFPQSINADEMMKAASNSDKVLALLHKITPADKIKIMQWDLLGIIIIGFFSYITMFWTQAVISEGKRPFKAYWESIKTVFKNPVATMVIYSSQCAGIIGVSFISAAYSLNVVIQFIALVVLTLVIIYFTMMSFLYFERYR